MILNVNAINLRKSYIQSLYYFYQNLAMNKLSPLKILTRFDFISFYIYNQLWKYYQYLCARQYFLFSKMQYLKFTKKLTVRNFRFFIYRNSPLLLKERIMRMLGKRKKKKIKFIKYPQFLDGLGYAGLSFSWHAIVLCALRIRKINRNFSFYRSRFRGRMSLMRPLFIHIYNQKFLSKYSDLQYKWYSKHDLPFNIYFEHMQAIGRFDLSDFLNKFIGMFIFSGNKHYALKLINLFCIQANKINLNFYTLLRHFIFNYSPFVYLKVLIVKRRRLTRPTLLTKEKAFFLVIKWWKEAAMARKGSSLASNLFAELLEIYANKGFVVQKFRNLLVSAFNARSDLRHFPRRPRAYDRDKSFLWGSRFRKFLNKFVHNTIVSNKKWVRRILWRRRAMSSFVIKKFLLKSYKKRKKRKWFSGNKTTKVVKFSIKQILELRRKKALELSKKKSIKLNFNKKFNKKFNNKWRRKHFKRSHIRSKNVKKKKINNIRLKIN